MAQSKEVRNAWKRAYNALNKEKRKAYAEANKERISEQKRIYYLANKEKIDARNIAYNQKNQAIRTIKHAEWRANNPGKAAAIVRKYQASKLQRTPKWLTDIDHERIQNEYKLAALQTKITGEPWHVDHIIPLQGKIVSGLHVPSNLRAIRGLENQQKSNKL